MRVSGFFCFLALLMATSTARASTPMTATRTHAHVSVDGKLNEAAWAEAKPFTDFVESFPSTGAAPTFRTEARVLYDDHYLYVSVVAFDPNPERIVKQLGRRDSTPTADLVEVDLSSSGDSRTAYGFSVNAAGVLRDKLMFSDVNATDTWDALYEGAARVTATGWTAELAIPLHSLRFSPADRDWGILIRRTCPRTHQVFDSVLMPHNVNPVDPSGVVVSHFGVLTGFESLKPTKDLELTPYLAARAAERPLHADPFRPAPRLLDGALDVGLDFSLAVTSNLTLSGALNPDFGQVEADQLLQNLSTSEPYFPEKRPLFTQGMDVFQPVGSEYGDSQTLFYSRRIGLDVPILGAAKLTGTVFGRTEVGVFDAVTLGSSSPLGDEGQPDRRWRLFTQRPLHLGPDDSLPTTPPQTTNYLAAVVRERFGANSSVGAVFTAATPLVAPCRGCFTEGANALALDWNLKNRASEWGVLGQLAASQYVSSNPAGTVLQDGTALRPGTLGYGGNVRAGKLGGDPFRFDVVYSYADPRFDLNAVGYQPLSNYQWADLDLHYLRPQGMGPFHNFTLDYNLDFNWSADGRFTPRGANQNIVGRLQLPSYDRVGVKLFQEAPQYDTREIPKVGVGFERRRDFGAALILNTDPSRRFIFNGDVFGYWMPSTVNQAKTYGWGWDAGLLYQPTDSLETRLDSSFGHKPQGARWLETGANNSATFGVQDPSFLSVTLRQQLVVTSTLTFQVYAQLFSSAVRYGPYYTASLNGRRELPAAALLPAASGPDANSHEAALNLNAVLRWEYRLGSTLFLVYTRSQGELAQRSGSVITPSFLPSHLFEGPATDTVLVKWSYAWST